MAVADAVRGLSETLVVVKQKDALSVEAQKNSTLMFLCLLRSTLSSKRVLSEFRLTNDAFKNLIGEVESRFNKVCSPCT